MPHQIKLWLDKMLLKYKIVIPLTLAILDRNPHFNTSPISMVIKSLNPKGFFPQTHILPFIKSHMHKQRIMLEDNGLVTIIVLDCNQFFVYLFC